MGVVGVMARRVVGSFCVLVGVALGYASISGSYRAWVSQSPVLIALSSVGLVMVGLTTACQREHCGCGNHDHGWSPWVLGFLAVIIVGASPAALQPAQVETANRVVLATNNGGTMPPLPAGETPELEIPDIIGRLMAPADDQLRGKKVQVTGQLSVEHGVSLLSRVVIICCACLGLALSSAIGCPLWWLRRRSLRSTRAMVRYDASLRSDRVPSMMGNTIHIHAKIPSQHMAVSHHGAGAKTGTRSNAIQTTTTGSISVRRGCGFTLWLARNCWTCLR